MSATKYDHKELQRRLKEDELGLFFEELTENTKRFFADYGRLLGYALALALVIALAGYLWMMKKRSDFTESQILLGNATLYIQQDKFQDALNPLGKIVSEYAGTAIAPFAYVLRGDCYFQTKQFDLALKDYQAALPKLNPNDAIPVRIAMIQTLRSLGNADPALREIEQMESSVKTPTLKEHLLFLKGGCYEDKNDAAKALEAYKAIPKDSRWRGLALERIEWIETQPVPAVNS